MPDINILKILKHSINENSSMLNSLLESDRKIQIIAKMFLNTLKNDGCIYFCGNGGSASDCQHIVAELVGRFKKNRSAFSAVSLGDNIASLTAISNDYSFEDIFVRQVSGLAKKNDLIVGVSTSGKSKNILNALNWAKKNNINSILITGLDGPDLDETFVLQIPAKKTERIQEGYMVLLHSICEYIENELTDND